MTQYPIDHDTCSELLGAHIREELTEDLRAAVDAHLAGCDSCAAERSALVALLAPEEGLTDLERVRLHRALEGTLFGEEKTPAKAGPGLWARLYPALGAAAAVLILFVGGSVLLRSGSEDEGAEGGAPMEAPAPGESGVEDQATAGVEELDSESKTLRAQDLVPTVVEDAGELTAARADHIGRSEGPFVAFARAYMVADARARAGEFAAKLSSAAGEAEEEVGRCVEATLESYPDSLPAWLGFGTSEGRPALGIGLVRSGTGEGPLDHYVIRVIERPDCTQIFDATGPIDV